VSWPHRNHLLKRGGTLVRCSLEGAQKTTPNLAKVNSRQTCSIADEVGLEETLAYVERIAVRMRDELEVES
jgi:hypothetical protein